MGFNIDITDELNEKFDKLTAEVQRIVQDELNAFGLETVAMAKQLAPVDIGFLRNGITYDMTDPLTVEIISAYLYSAYIEFGTGLFAAAYVPTLPPEIQAYAMTFYVNGKGRIKPHPFLFPSVEYNFIKLKATLKTLLHAG